MDETFGEDNFCGIISFRKTGSFETLLLQRNFDYIVWYAKKRTCQKFRRLPIFSTPVARDTQFYDRIEEEGGFRRPLTKQEKTIPLLCCKGHG